MKIAFIGTGLMGKPMAERVLKAHHELIVFNRTVEKTTPLKSLGASVADNPGEAIRASECVILMVSDYAAICDVILSATSLPHLSGRTVIQMGTISPVKSMALKEKLSECRCEYLEAPVLGSIPEASAGSLIIMVGASPDQFDRFSSFLTCFGPEPLLIGPVGRAAAIKLALNQLIASLTAAFALSLSFVRRSEIEADLFMRILRGSALYAPTFDKKLERMIESNFDNPNFPSKHMVKDVDLFLEAAKPLNIETAGLEGISRLLKRACDKGFSEKDYAAIYEIIHS